MSTRQPRVMTPKEARAFLRISDATYYRLRRSGTLVPDGYAGQKARFLEASLLAFLRNCTGPGSYSRID